LSVNGAGREWTVICNGERAQLAEAAGKIGGRIITERSPSLNQIFVARAGRKVLVQHFLSPQ
jgi:ABC-2 type transport system ATP-binding protein